MDTLTALLVSSVILGGTMTMGVVFLLWPWMAADVNRITHRATVGIGIFFLLLALFAAFLVARLLLSLVG